MSRAPVRHRGCAAAIMPRLRARMAGDRGAATVLVLAATALTLAVAVAVGLLGAGLRAGARARTAADLAALAAADALATGRDACGEAASVARRNAAALVSCRAGTRGVTVVVQTRVLAVRVRAAARAVPGPAAATLAAASRMARSPPGYERRGNGRGGPRALPVLLVRRRRRSPVLPVLRNADGHRRRRSGHRRRAGERLLLGDTYDGRAGFGARQRRPGGRRGRRRPGRAVPVRA